MGQIKNIKLHIVTDIKIGRSLLLQPRKNNREATPKRGKKKRI